MGYTKTAIKGISWVGILKFLTRVLTLIRTAILARILSPFEFGLFGIAGIITAFLETATETGVNVVLVQEDTEIDKYISSAWIVSIARGAIIAFFMIIFAPVIAYFFNSKESMGLIFLMSVVPLVRSFINPSVVKFQKELQFHFEFIYSFSSFIVLSFVSIIAAFIMKNAYALIIGLTASALSEVVMSYFIAKPRPRFILDKEYLKIIFHRGKWITMAGIFEYLFQNLDNIVVGRLLGVAPLGLYQMGYKISILPISEGTEVLSRVTFPVYVKISGEPVRLKKAFFRTMKLLALVTIPFGVVVFIFPREIIQIVLGDKWLGIVPFLRILAIFGVIRALSNLTASVFMALKEQKKVALLAFLSFLILAATIVPLVFMFGLVGAAFSVLIVSLIVFPASLFYLNKLLRNA